MRSCLAQASADGADGKESAEEAYQRRLRESQRVEERVDVIFSEEEFREELKKASPGALKAVAACAFSIAVVPKAGSSLSRAGDLPT